MSKKIREYEIELRAGREGGRYEVVLKAFRGESRPLDLSAEAARGAISFSPGEIWRSLGASDYSEARDFGPNPRDPGRPGVGAIIERPKEAAERIGKALYKAIHGHLLDRDLAVSPDWKQSLSEAEGIRVVLSFDWTQPEVSSLLRIPWETLFSDEVGYLGLHGSFSLVRRLGSVHQRQDRKTKHVRVLVIVADVENQAPINFAEELLGIEQARQEARNLSYKVLQARAYEKLRSELRATDYHVIHFIGHGMAPAGVGKKGKLIFEGEKREGEEVDADEFVDRIKDQFSLKLVVLNTCHGANTEGHGGDVATLLAARGIPAVIAMQSKIDDRGAVAFTRELYLGLARGDGIERALVEGRQAISGKLRDSAEWAKPVLYLQRDVKLGVKKSVYSSVTRAIKALVLSERQRLVRLYDKYFRTSWRASAALLGLLLLVINCNLLCVSFLNEKVVDRDEETWWERQRLTVCFTDLNKQEPCKGGPFPEGDVEFMTDAWEQSQKRKLQEGKAWADVRDDEVAGLRVSAALDGFCSFRDREIPIVDSAMPTIKMPTIELCKEPDPSSVKLFFDGNGWDDSLADWRNQLEQDLQTEGYQLILQTSVADSHRCELHIKLDNELGRSGCTSTAKITVRLQTCSDEAGGCYYKPDGPEIEGDGAFAIKDWCEEASQVALSGLNPLVELRRYCHD